MVFLYGVERPSWLGIWSAQRVRVPLSCIGSDLYEQTSDVFMLDVPTQPTGLTLGDRIRESPSLFSMCMGMGT